MNYLNDISFSVLRKARLNKRPGVYVIQNLVNDKKYIGSSSNAKNRMKIHLNELRKGIHNNTHLQRAWNKYGEKAFKFNIILYCHKEDLLVYEQYYINLFRVALDKYGYNKCPNANGTLGYKWTIGQRINASKSHKGQQAWNKDKTGIYSEETKIKMSNAMKGRVPWNKGIPRTVEEKLKMSKNMKGRAAWNKGISTKELVGAKIAEANRKRVWKEETRLKMSKSRKGKKLSETHCKAISDGLKGRTLSDETKQKISNTLKNKAYA